MSGTDDDRARRAGSARARDAFASWPGRYVPDPERLAEGHAAIDRFWWGRGFERGGAHRRRHSEERGAMMIVGPIDI